MRLSFGVLVLLALPLAAPAASAYRFTCETETGTGVCVGEYENGSDPRCAEPGSSRRAQTGVGVEAFDVRLVSVDGYDWCDHFADRTGRRQALAVYYFFGTVRYTHDECWGGHCGAYSDTCRIEHFGIVERGSYVPCWAPDPAWGRMLP